MLEYSPRICNRLSHREFTFMAANTPPATPDEARGEDTRLDLRVMADTPPTPATTGWCPFADRRATNNFWSARDNQRVKAVVLHIAQGSYQGAIDWLSNPASDASAHFIIAKDGRIAQLVSVDDT